MHSNTLTSLPPQLGQLANVQVLQLHNNPDLIVLPREILYLNSLQQLSCANIEVNGYINT